MKTQKYNCLLCQGVDTVILKIYPVTNNGFKVEEKFCSKCGKLSGQSHQIFEQFQNNKNSSCLPADCQNGWENSDYCMERGKCKKCL